MYIEPESEPQPVRVAASLQAALAVAVLLVMFIGVYPQPLIRMTQRAATSRGLKTEEEIRPPAPAAPAGRERPPGGRPSSSPPQ
jgi:hypothetical protein